MFPVLDLQLNFELRYLWKDKLLLLIASIQSEQLKLCRAKSDFQILQDPHKAGTEEKWEVFLQVSTKKRINGGLCITRSL